MGVLAHMPVVHHVSISVYHVVTSRINSAVCKHDQTASAWECLISTAHRKNDSRSSRNSKSHHLIVLHYSTSPLVALFTGVPSKLHFQPRAKRRVGSNRCVRGLAVRGDELQRSYPTSTKSIHWHTFCFGPLSSLLFCCCHQRTFL